MEGELRQSSRPQRLSSCGEDRKIRRLWETMIIRQGTSDIARERRAGGVQRACIQAACEQVVGGGKGCTRGGTGSRSTRGSEEARGQLASAHEEKPPPSGPRSPALSQPPFSTKALWGMPVPYSSVAFLSPDERPPFTSQRRLTLSLKKLAKRGPQR